MHGSSGHDHETGRSGKADGALVTGRRRRRRVCVAVVACGLMTVAVFALDNDRAAVGAPVAPAGPSSAVGAASVGVGLGVPAGYLSLYRRAAARYGLDWVYLAAVGSAESDHGRASLSGVRRGANAAGAAGPAQFVAATWQRFGVDANGDGRRDPHDPADAIFAMAAYLRASGAPENWTAALGAYNHSPAYVRAVMRTARPTVAMRSPSISRCRSALRRSPVGRSPDPPHRRRPGERHGAGVASAGCGRPWTGRASCAVWLSGRSPTRH